MQTTPKAQFTPGPWKPGLPPGKMTRANKQWFLDTYGVYFSPGGAIWHRKKADDRDDPDVCPLCAVRGCMGECAAERDVASPR